MNRNSARLVTFDLRYIRWTWTFAVFGLIDSSSEISSALLPRNNNSATWRSLLVRLNFSSAVLLCVKRQNSRLLKTENLLSVWSCLLFTLRGCHILFKCDSPLCWAGKPLFSYYCSVVISMSARPSWAFLNTSRSTPFISSTIRDTPLT